MITGALEIVFHSVDDLMLWITSEVHKVTIDVSEGATLER